VNLDPNKVLKLKTGLQGIRWQNVTGSIVTSARLTDINTFDKPEAIRVQTFNGAKKRGTHLEVDLPAKSVVMLELK
jgi:alpha-N-arabinofuranosidase